MKISKQLALSFATVLSLSAYPAEQALASAPDLGNFARYLPDSKDCNSGSMSLMSSFPVVADGVSSQVTFRIVLEPSGTYTISLLNPRDLGATPYKSWAGLWTLTDAQTLQLGDDGSLADGIEPDLLMEAGLMEHAEPVQFPDGYVGIGLPLVATCSQ